jgi:hypothetical protein
MFSGARPIHRFDPIDTRGWHTKARMANAPTRQQKQEAIDRRISLLLLLSAHASLRIKSKGLSINAPYNLYYFSYVPSTAQKKQEAPYVCPPNLVLG